MEESLKYYMLSSEKAGKAFANIYDDLSKLKRDYLRYKDKFAVKTFLLTPVEEDEDLTIAKVGTRWIACMDPKEEVENTERMLKVQQQEIKIKE